MLLKEISVNQSYQSNLWSKKTFILRGPKKFNFIKKTVQIMLGKIVKGLFGAEEKKEEVPVENQEMYEEVDMEGLEDEELLISQILGDAETDVEQMDAFKEYLIEKLIFPFSAEYCSDVAGAIPDDAVVNVLKMHGVDDEYGIMVVIKYENEMHTVPLYNLVVEDEEADNYDALEIYSIWFDNKD